MAEERKGYPVLSPVKHGGKRVDIGGSVSLTIEEFQALQPLGVVGEALTPEQIAEARAAAIAAFIPTLTIADMGKKSALTDAGKAKAEAALGFVPDTDELRAAFQAYEKARADTDAKGEASPQ